MGQEQTKSAKRRFNIGKFHSRYFWGHGLDIGAGRDSLANHKKVFRGISKIDSWDKPNGDAQYLNGVVDGYYDFVHSSHCLEHMIDPYVALRNWIRVVKPGGHVIITIPEQELYEHGVWPSRFNRDHKWTFTIGHTKYLNIKEHINVLHLIQEMPGVRLLNLELIDDFYDENDMGDQTRTITTECAIEFILRKS